MNWKRSILIKIFEIVFYTDQNLRVCLPKVKGTFSRYLTWYLIKSMDVINQIVIHAILNKIGWPYKSIYGDKVSLTAYYVIMHSSKEKIRKYIKQLAFATELGEADCQHLANMIDRLLKYRGKKQIYGNAIRGLKINGQLQYYIYPIVNFKDVNKRRKKIGLKHTIEEYAEINNAILNYGDDISIRLTRYLCD